MCQITGGALAWNSIYREIREDAQAVDIWTLDLLAHLMISLDLAQADDPALGTHEQTKSAISHIERIIKVKSDLFQKVRFMSYGVFHIISTLLRSFMFDYLIFTISVFPHSFLQCCYC